MPVTYGTAPTQVNSPSPDTVQNFSTVADIPGFGYVVLWQGPGYNTTFPFETGIFGQCYNYAGEKVGGQFQVTGSDTTGFLSDADVVGEPNGAFTVTWSGPDGSFPGIFMRPFFFGGSSAGAVSQVNTAEEGSQEYSQVTRLANGNILVTWESSGPGQAGVFARLYDSFHQPLGDQFQVNSSPAGFTSGPNVTKDVSGGFVIVWQNTPGSNDTDVLMQRFDANGAKVGTEILMSGIDHGAAHNPVITTLTNGTYVVAWDVGPPGFVGSEIIAQRFGLNGEKLGDEVQVTAGADYTGRDPAIIATADGGFAITYYSGTQIMLRTFDSQGKPVGDPWPIAEDQGSLQFQPDIAQLGDGSFIVSWSGTDVFTERFHINPYPTEGYLTEDNDRAMGGSDSDFLSGLGGNDLLRGGEGDDILEGGLGADRLIGGLGRDEATYANAGAAVTLNLITGGHSGEAQGDTFEGIEQISLTRFNDRVIGGDLDDVIYGLDGNDILSGGAGINRLDGGDGNDLLEGGLGTDILIGGDGMDEVTYIHAAFGVGIDLAMGYAAGAAAADTYVSIEKFTLSRFNDGFGGGAGVDRVAGGMGDDGISGREGNDILDGGDGTDTLDGGAGADQMIGGFGNDYFYVDDAADMVLEYRFGGGDLVTASVSYALAAGMEIETLQAAPAGPGVAAINLTGNEFANRLIGNDGANILDGRGGIDVMTGGGGDDKYYVDTSLDQVVEVAGGGNDRVFASTSYTLAPGLSVEWLTTEFNTSTTAINLTGNELANMILGNAGANILAGGSGNDVLDGKEGNDLLSGGADNDTLYGREGNDLLYGGTGVNYLAGGLGDDLYFVDNGTDMVVELAGEGTDRVFASVSYTLTAGTSVETLSTTDNAGTAAISLSGNELANMILGNAGANSLQGGAGNDVLDGKEGNDILSGGADSDMLYGRDGNDQLYGGTGTNYLAGGIGDDLYFVENGTDTVAETMGQGADRIFASVSYTLAAGVSVETLSTTDNAGTGAINLTGNELANTLFGNNGANVLNGGGGSDTLDGKGGADTFAFTTALGAGNVDTVIGFQTAVDKIALDDAVFAGIGGLGTLSPGAFVAGAAAADGSDRIIYNATTGALLFDADGSGAGAAVQFATLATGLNLTASDFLVF